jgi:predicted kinase
MPICYIMVGLPGVGKSTYIQNNIQNTTVHSSDQIIEDYAKSMNLTYDDVFKNYIDEATKIFRQNVQDSIKNNESFIIDRTNLTKKSRRAILSPLPKHYIKKAIVIEVNDVTHTKYLGNRKTKTIPQSVIDNFKNIFEMPTVGEGFDEIIHIKKE